MLLVLVLFSIDVLYHPEYLANQIWSVSFPCLNLFFLRHVVALERYRVELLPKDDAPERHGSHSVRVSEAGKMLSFPSPSLLMPWIIN